MGKTYLFTGGTGFLGSYLAKKLLAEGHHLLFVGRSKNEETFKQRIQKEFGLHDNYTCVDGDLVDGFTSLGKSLQAIQKKIDGIWHLAADLSFNDRDKQRVWKTNLDGTKDIINVSKKFGLPLYYVSTAYVHGCSNGVVREEFNSRPKKFNNSYEESKFEAEQLIKNSSVKYIVFRPSILIDREVRRINNFGYYSFLISLVKLRKSLNINPDMNLLFPVPLLYYRKATLNLMPVDIAVDWFYAISMDPRSYGKIFHICNPVPPTVGKIFKQTLKAFSISLPLIAASKFLVFSYITFAGPLSVFFRPMKSMTRKLRYFRGYLLSNTHYNMSNTELVIGKNLIEYFNFSDNYIYDLATIFRSKMK